MGRSLLKGGVIFEKAARENARTRSLFRQWHFSGVWPRDPSRHCRTPNFSR